MALKAAKHQLKFMLHLNHHKVQVDPEVASAIF